MASDWNGKSSKRVSSVLFTDAVGLMLLCFAFFVLDSCSVCSHVIADHYYSFRMTKTVNGVDASDESKADELPSDSTGDVTKVTHDYYMECVLCGKGTDEQVHIDRENAPNDNDHDAVPNAQTQSNATIALANIQIRSNNANGASNNDDGDEDEWA